MRLRVAKKVFMARQCRAGSASWGRGRRGCHRWSTVELAGRRLRRAFYRGGPVHLPPMEGWAEYRLSRPRSRLLKAIPVGAITQELR